MFISRNVLCPAVILCFAKDSDKYAYVHLWSPNNGDKNQQATDFWACLFYNMFL